MPSFFVVLSSGQTTNLTGADYHMRFVKCLTLCEVGGGPDYQAREPHNQTTKQQQKQQGRLPLQ